jgi:hypothetical protein
MSAALENGLSVTALHNHFSSIIRKFISCTSKAGNSRRLATAVRKVYEKIKEIRAANPQPKDAFGRTALPEKTQFRPMSRPAARAVETPQSRRLPKFAWHQRWLATP